MEFKPRIKLGEVLDQSVPVASESLGISSASKPLNVEAENGETTFSVLVLYLPAFQLMIVGMFSNYGKTNCRSIIILKLSTLFASVTPGNPHAHFSSSATGRERDEMLGS